MTRLGLAAFVLLTLVYLVIGESSGQGAVKPKTSLAQALNGKHVYWTQQPSSRGARLLVLNEGEYEKLRDHELVSDVDQIKGLLTVGRADGPLATGKDEGDGDRFQDRYQRLLEIESIRGLSGSLCKVVFAGTDFIQLKTVSGRYMALPVHEISVVEGALVE